MGISSTKGKRRSSRTGKNSRTCEGCHNSVSAGEEYCPHCGRVFGPGLKCTNHHATEAAGVCIICGVPYCGRCGGRVNSLFLCRDHEDREIFEGMVRVFGISDEVAAQHAVQCLKQAGLQPFLYTRKASAISLGGPDYTLFRASGEYDGHIINEWKVMVPCQEVLQAEVLLRKLNIKSKKSG